jgi:hypothetical protein
VVGGVLAGSIHAGAALLLGARKAANAPFAASTEIVGGIAGGFIGGALTGAAVGWYFGKQPLPTMEAPVLALSAALGVISIVLSSLLIDYQGSTRRLLRAVFLSGAVTLVSFAPFAWLVDQDVLDWIFARGQSDDSKFIYAFGGTLLGAVVGSVMGAQTGLVFAAYRWLKQVQREDDRSREVGRQIGARIRRFFRVLAVAATLPPLWQIVSDGSNLLEAPWNYCFITIALLMLLMGRKTELEVTKDGLKVIKLIGEATPAPLHEPVSPSPGQAIPPATLREK